MAGMDRITGKPLGGWAHVVQSLAVLFTTPKGARVMRRHVGSNLPRLVDGPISSVKLIDFYAAAAGAIDELEPRFKVTRFAAAEVAKEGRLMMEAEGVYFPRGHLGDFSTQEPKNARVAL